MTPNTSRAAPPPMRRIPPATPLALASARSMPSPAKSTSISPALLPWLHARARTQDREIRASGTLSMITASLHQTSRWPAAVSVRVKSVSSPPLNPYFSSNRSPSERTTRISSIRLPAPAATTFVPVGRLRRTKNRPAVIQGSTSPSNSATTRPATAAAPVSRWVRNRNSSHLGSGRSSSSMNASRSAAALLSRARFRAADTPGRGSISYRRRSSPNDSTMARALPAESLSTTRTSIWYSSGYAWFRSTTCLSTSGSPAIRSVGRR